MEHSKFGILGNPKNRELVSDGTARQLPQSPGVLIQIMSWLYQAKMTDSVCGTSPWKLIPETIRLVTKREPRSRNSSCSCMLDSKI